MAEYHPIEQEVLQIVNTWAFNFPDRNKDFRYYRKWLAEECDKMEDEEWEQLSDEAQDWVNASLIALNNSHWPPNFGDPYEKTESMQSSKVLRPDLKYKKNSVIVRLREIFCEYGMDVDYDTASMILAKSGMETSQGSFAVQKSYFQNIVKILERYGYLEPGKVPLVRIPEEKDKKNRFSEED